MSMARVQTFIPAVAAAVAAIYLCKSTVAALSTPGSRTRTSKANTNSPATIATSTVVGDKNSKNYLLVGDIGGTNTRLALYDPSSFEEIHYKEYLNSQYITGPRHNTFEKEIFTPFLLECCNQERVVFDDASIIVACFAVAGPVNKNRCILTNLGEDHAHEMDKNNDNNETDISRIDPAQAMVDAANSEIMIVELDGDSVEKNSNGLLKYIKRCKVVNDFVGQGYGLLDLKDTEVEELIPGSKDKIDPDGPKACLGAGTGLGECYLTKSSLHPEEKHECYGSEGGHVDFVPRSDLQVKLLNYLKDKFNQKYRVSVERVVSGKGLANCYEFLSKTFPKKTRKGIQEEFESADDMQGRVVGVNANDKDDPCPLCVEAMEIMMSAYGAEAGNCAMKFIPTGGLYVSGGLTHKNIKFMSGKDSPFMKAYYDKGRMSSLVDQIPLFAVMVEDIGMRGARVCASREYESIVA